MYTCEYKIDKDSDGSLMPIKMYRTLFPHTKLNESINKNVVLCTCNNSCILQMDICRGIIINEDIEYQCNFFVVPGIGLALLGMPECEWLQLLRINCQATNDQCKEDKLTNKQSKISPNQTVALKKICILTAKLNRE